MLNLYKVWLYSLGSYSDDKTKPYDRPMLIIRSIWVIIHLLTCMFIIIGNGRILGLW